MILVGLGAADGRIFLPPPVHPLVQLFIRRSLIRPCQFNHCSVTGRPRPKIRYGEPFLSPPCPHKIKLLVTLARASCFRFQLFFLPTISMMASLVLVVKGLERFLRPGCLLVVFIFLDGSRDITLCPCAQAFDTSAIFMLTCC